MGKLHFFMPSGLIWESILELDFWQFLRGMLLTNQPTYHQQYRFSYTPLLIMYGFGEGGLLEYPINNCIF